MTVHLPRELMARAARGRTAQAVLRAGGGVALGAALVALALPKVTGAEWAGVADQITQLTPAQLAVPLLVWLTSLYANAVVSTAALPGLSVGQALTMGLAGSAMSNVAPLGPAFGVGVNYAMARSWGFQAGPFALFTLLTGLLNLLVRLVLPVLALVLIGPTAGERMGAAAASAGVLLAAVLAALALALRSAETAERMGATAQEVAGRALRLVGSRATPQWDVALVRARAQVLTLLHRRWPTLTVAMVACTAAQAALLWLCLRAVGIDLGAGAVLAVFAVDRVLSSVPLTPSGVGITETGCVAVLVALGAAPEAGAAGVLLFRGFTYVAEIPAGALAGLVWLGRRSWRRSPPPARATGGADTPAAAGVAGAAGVTGSSRMPS